MLSPKNKITGILLAGGMSQRMGKEKGIIRIGPKYLYQYGLEILENLCDEVLISTCKEGLFFENYLTFSVPSSLLLSRLMGLSPAVYPKSAGLLPHGSRASNCHCNRQVVTVLSRMV